MSFAYSGSFCWNALPRSLKIACSVSTFTSKALQHFLMFDTPAFYMFVYKRVRTPKRVHAIMF